MLIRGSKSDRLSSANLYAMTAEVSSNLLAVPVLDDLTHDVSLAGSRKIRPAARCDSEARESTSPLINGSRRSLTGTPAAAGKTP